MPVKHIAPFGLYCPDLGKISEYDRPLSGPPTDIHRGNRPVLRFFNHFVRQSRTPTQARFYSGAGIFTAVQELRYVCLFKRRH